MRQLFKKIAILIQNNSFLLLCYRTKNIFNRVFLYKRRTREIIFFTSKTDIIMKRYSKYSYPSNDLLFITKTKYKYRYNIHKNATLIFINKSKIFYTRKTNITYLTYFKYTSSLIIIS